MRDVSMDKSIASRVLGPDVAYSFLSLVADMRDAMFAGEVADTPEVRECEGRVQLLFALPGGLELDVEPQIGGGNSMDRWKDAFRVKLLGLRKNGRGLL